MAEKKHPILTVLVILGCVALLLGASMAIVLKLFAPSSDLSFGDKIGVIPVGGTISDSHRTTSQLVKFRKDKKIKAIILRINSPGGAVGPTQEIYREVRKTIETKKVVASLGMVAASGGYYIACGADKILAHPASITGSIGVYLQMVNAADLLEEIGVEGIIVRSRDSKAAGNWFEHPTEEQLGIEQAIVNALHDLFVSVVAKGRDMDEVEVRKLADGRPYTGQQALDLGLVDDLGNLSDAISAAAEIAGIDGEPQVLKYRHTPSLLETWFGAQQSRRSEIALPEWLDAQPVVPQMRYLGP